ncbi:hypothetical protein NDU88_005952 [Pleurodeles waltl]|uniref:G-protein coupled receptors family 1 profile domain-containing protein n=1 Tax=Pleurodeles waltl TaxID=8319 RepID=A0AAV7UKR7_PLEWA|nr:hypothetical protein NDU88_005952 [Pleurodeles waltl]
MGHAEAFEELLVVYYVALGLIGIPANLFAAFVVLRRPCSLSKTTTIYLVALAMSDTVCLAWAAGFNLSKRLWGGSESPWIYKPWCGLALVLEYGAMLCSAWIIVAFTLERYVVLFCERARRVLARPKVALATVGAVVLLSYLVACGAYLLNEYMRCAAPLSEDFEAALGGDRCYVPNSTYFSTSAWVHTTICGGVPFFLILLFSSLIAHQLRGTMRVKIERDSAAFRLTQARARRSVGLLLTISLTAVCLGLPRFVAECIPYSVGGLDSLGYSAHPSVAAEVTVMLQWLNSGLDFCLYCLACSAFRHQCAAMLHHSGCPTLPAKVTTLKPDTHEPEAAGETPNNTLPARDLR